MPTYRIGPARLMIAPSFASPLTDWVDMGYSRGDVSVNLTPSVIARGKVDQIGPIPFTEAITIAPKGLTARVPLADRDIAKIAQAFPGAVSVTAGSKKALTLPAAPQQYSTVAVALLPELDIADKDNPNPFDSAHAIYFELAWVKVVELTEGAEVTDDDDALNVFQVEIERVLGSGAAGIGYPWLNPGLTNPLGILYSWQPALDDSTPAIGTGEIAALATFPAAGVTILVQLSDAGASGAALIGDASLEAAKYSLGVDSTASWARVNNTLYTQAGLGGVAETVMQLAVAGTVNGWDDSTQDITAAATASVSGLTLKSAGDDITVSYDEADVTAIVIVLGLLTPEQIRTYVRS